MRTLLAAAVALAGFVLAGCGSQPRSACAFRNCSPCPPGAVVLVTDARTSQPIPGTTVTGGDAPWTCTQEQANTVCTSLQLTTTGAFDVQVSAPGYATATAHVTEVVRPDDCCPGCQVYTPVSVQLTPS